MSQTSLSRIALRSLRFFARSHGAIGLGVAAATAVILGALVIGDSVRNSLRTLVLERLDNVVCLMHSRSFFDPSMLEPLTNADANQTSIERAILFRRTTVESRKEEGLTRASSVQLLAVGEDYWSKLSTSPLEGPLQEDEVAVNETLARELGVSLGDEITILVTDPSGIPSDNPLGRREDKSISVPRQKIVGILPDQGPGGLSFSANQSSSRNVFASLTTIQDILECGEQVNAAFAMTKRPFGEYQQFCDELNLRLSPKLEDYGLQFERHQRVFPDESRGETLAPDASPQVIYDYYQLSSTQLIIDFPTSRAVFDQFGEGKTSRLITYLVNTIAKVEPPAVINAPRASNFENTRPVDKRSAMLQPGVSIGEQPVVDAAPENEEVVISREVPYSIVVGVEHPSDLHLRDFPTKQRLPANELRVPYCLVNSWLAEQLDVQPGDWIRTRYFEPETIDGKEIETSLQFQVGGILPLTEPVSEYTRSKLAVYEEPPTVFNDPNLTPSVKGITDQDSMLSWDTPFELTYPIDSKTDDKYFKNHRLTPKFFFPYYHTKKFRLFQSRFGRTTAFRFAVEDRDPEKLGADLRKEIEEALQSTRSLRGLIFLPIRDQQLSAASGTTPFDALFLSLSFFVIVAALLLVYLLFKLGIQTRLSELGILQAQGFSSKRIRRLLLTEFSLVAAAGAVLGVLLGLLYARGLILLLESWWIGAISSRFLRFHASPTTLILGASIGYIICLLAIYFGIRRACKQQPLSNLRGGESAQLRSSTKSRGIAYGGGIIFAMGALGLGFGAMSQAGMAKAGSFFGSGMLLLVACIFVSRQWLEPSDSQSPSGDRWTLALRSIGRNPNRSILTIGLLSVASFLIASMSVFQISPSEKGYGGFNLIAQSSQPIYKNIGSGSVRSERLGDKAKGLLGSSIIPLRARFGDDASCNNLFQVQTPTILGLPETLSEMHDFAPESVEFEWANTTKPDNPWTALTEPSNGSEYDPYPVILDLNTAMWSLKQGASIGSKIKLTIDDKVVYFKTVGLLSNSVLQGKLIISQEHFERVFPNVSGYSFFLINSGDQREAADVTEILESGWGDEGLDVQYSQEVLAKFLGVQNTYIMAFQSLGALGLLLGTFGLIAVQVRSVLERKREFALMRAVGFSPQRLAGILVAETTLLLGGGLCIGLVCALVALVPYFIEVGPQISLLSPFVMLGLVILAGFLAAVASIRAANKQSVLEGLRSE